MFLLTLDFDDDDDVSRLKTTNYFCEIDQLIPLATQTAVADITPFLDTRDSFNLKYPKKILSLLLIVTNGERTYLLPTQLVCQPVSSESS